MLQHLGIGFGFTAYLLWWHGVQLFGLPPGSVRTCSLASMGSISARLAQDPALLDSIASNPTVNGSRSTLDFLPLKEGGYFFWWLLVRKLFGQQLATPRPKAAVSHLVFTTGKWDAFLVMSLSLSSRLFWPAIGDAREIRLHARAFWSYLLCVTRQQHLMIPQAVCTSLPCWEQLLLLFFTPPCLRYQMPPINY